MIIVAGTARIPPAHMERWRAAAADVIAATRAEAGCQVYAFAEDALEPGLVRIFEIWDSHAHLDAHLKMPHLTVWRQVLAELGTTDRAILAYEAEEGHSF